MKPRGIIFDLDGTLYRMPWFFKPLFTLRLLPHGLRLPVYMRVRAQCAGRDFLSAEALMQHLSAALGHRLGIEESRAQEWIATRFYPGFIAMMRLVRHTRPGVNELLATLRAGGVRVAVLSDFASVSERLRALEIDCALFDTLEASEIAGALKPSPRPFGQIASRWGISPEQILVVGDRDDTDGQGARQAGMAFVLLGGRHGTDWEQLCARLQREVAGL